MKYCASNQSLFDALVLESNIIKTPADYATPEEIEKYFSEDAHTMMIEQMTLNYTGNAICNGSTGTVMFPLNVITPTTIEKYLDIKNEKDKEIRIAYS